MSTIEKLESLIEIAKGQDKVAAAAAANEAREIARASRWLGKIVGSDRMLLPELRSHLEGAK